MTVGIGGQVLRPNLPYDYTFKIINEVNYMFKSNGAKQTIDNLDPLIDAIVDESYDTSAYVGKGAWEVTDEIPMIGLYPDFASLIVHGAGRYSATIEQMTSNKHIFHITDGSQCEIRELGMKMKATATAVAAIYGDNTGDGMVPPVTNYHSSSLYRGIIDNIWVTGVENKVGTGVYAIDLENPEMFHLSNFHIMDQGNNIGGVQVEVIDNDPNWSYADALISGKNLITLYGTADAVAMKFIGDGTDKVNLTTMAGTTWVRSANATHGIGLQIEDVQNVDLGQFHFENLLIGFDINEGYNIKIRANNKYNYVGPGGTMFDVENEVYGLLVEAQSQMNSGMTLIDDVGGSPDAPNIYRLTLNGASAPTMANTGYVIIDELSITGAVGLLDIDKSLAYA